MFLEKKKKKTWFINLLEKKKKKMAKEGLLFHFSLSDIFTKVLIIINVQYQT